MISQVKIFLDRNGRSSAPTEEEKKELFQKLRNSFPDNLLDWLDAAFVFSGDKLNPPPMLLSGGNEGNLDFSNTFIQNLLTVFDKDTESSQRIFQRVAKWRAVRRNNSISCRFKQRILCSGYPGRC